MEDRSLGDLFGELTDELRILLRQEVELAKAEMSEKVSHFSRDVVKIAAGAIVGFVAFQVLIATAILALALIIPAWLSALIVGVVLGIVGYAVLRNGLNDLQKRSVVPERTIESFKEDRQWVQNRMT
jgi:uncharacterized membrane protein